MCASDWVHFAIFISCDLDCDGSTGWAPHLGKSEVVSFRRKTVILNSDLMLDKQSTSQSSACVL